MYCRGQLVQLQNDLVTIQDAGLGLAAISYDSGAVLRDFAARKRISFPLLADHESKVIRAFGVQNRRFVKDTLLDVNTEQITNTWGDVPVFGVAYPSVFVIEPDGKVAWRLVSEADELRLTGKAILERSIGTIAGQSSVRVLNERAQVLVTASNTSIGLGNRVSIAVEIKLPEGFHVYGPNVGREYHGLEWRMDDSSCWYYTEAKYPEPLKERFAFDDHELPMYKGEVRISRELVLKPVLSTVDPSLYKLFKSVCLDAGGGVKSSGSLSLQTCDERQCYPPRSVPLEWKFKFVSPDMERSPPELRREFEQ